MNERVDAKAPPGGSPDRVRRRLLKAATGMGAGLLGGCAVPQGRPRPLSGDQFEAMLGAWLDLKTPRLVIRTVQCDYVFELPKYWTRVFTTPAALSLLLVQPRALTIASDGSVEGMVAFSVPRLYLSDTEDADLRASNWSTVRTSHPYLTKSVLMMVGDHELSGRRFQNRVMNSGADLSFAELILRSRFSSDTLISALPPSPVRVDASKVPSLDGGPLTPVLVPPRG